MSTLVPTPNPVPVPGQPSGAGTYYPGHPYANGAPAGPFGNHATLADNLVSYWTFDEASGTRFDSHGSNDLTDNNTVTSSTGVQGNAASFLATNSEYLNLASGISELDDQFTIAGWVKQSSYVSEAGLFANGADGDMGFRVTMNVIGNGDLLVRPVISATNTENLYGYTTTGVLPTGSWVYVLITYDGSDGTASNRLKVYINDTLTGTTKNGTHPTSIRVGGSFRIGRGGDANYTTSLYDEVSIWSRILTLGERAALYNAGAGLTY